jgi:hypothetical protein
MGFVMPGWLPVQQNRSISRSAPSKIPRICAFSESPKTRSLPLAPGSVLDSSVALATPFEPAPIDNCRLRKTLRFFSKTTSFSRRRQVFRGDRIQESGAALRAQCRRRATVAQPWATNATASIDRPPTNKRLRRSIVRVAKQQHTVSARDGGPSAEEIASHQRLRPRTPRRVDTCSSVS